MGAPVIVEPLDPADRAWARAFIVEHWGAETAIAHGAVYYPAELPGFVAVQDGERVGLITYDVVGTSCEVVTIDSTRPGGGIGLIVGVAEGLGEGEVWTCAS